MKMITLQIPVTAANALLDATSDPILLRSLAKALTGGSAAPAPKAEPKTKGKAKKLAKAEPKAKKPRAARGSAVDDAATVFTRMASGTEYSAETLRASTGLGKAAFGKAMRLLLDEKKVTRTGEKRGTKYTVA